MADCYRSHAPLFSVDTFFCGMPEGYGYCKRFLCLLSSICLSLFVLGHATPKEGLGGD